MSRDRGGIELVSHGRGVRDCFEENESASDAPDGGMEWVSSGDASEECVNDVDDIYSNRDDSGADEEGNEFGREDEDDRGEFRSGFATAFSNILARDLEIQQRHCQQMEGAGVDVNPRVATADGQVATAGAKEKICCICKDKSVYTCPGCGARTCSMTCVRVHKAQFNCSGERNVAEKVPLSEFTDKQLERDFHFLEDTRRVISNCERTFPKMWRYTFRALPPPLYALRKAAKQRGVVCQITSEGMSKRDANTSRFDRRTETIIWRCQFNFHTPNFTVSTDWGNERHKLGDILTYCWAKNPPVHCFHINRRYNRASKWIGIEGEREGKEVEREEEGEKDKENVENGREENESVEFRCSGASDNLADISTRKEDSNDEDGAVGPLFVEVGDKQQQQQVWKPSVLDISPQSPEEAKSKETVSAFLSLGPVIILAQAERLGLEKKYFRLSPSQTLNETLRTLFFINEFPVFEVIHASDLESYALVTDADKERIRESFRAAPRPPKPERPPRPTKSTLTPEERDRYAQVPCRLFLAGCCKLGEEECPYRHCEYQDVPVCRSFMKFASCEKGNRCVFRHDATAVATARKRMREGRQAVQLGRRRF
ncbi:HIT zinc finger, putative [Trypanosoma equiperdum]|uniref:HIT zinc finger, putative n=1 Tax=Trypanosoma equiperdum TaxID=5694 RepID=A0A1G4IEX1_TRYEQ|nr:HIT zinc finger, putative [Trypanosoma equiperdum]